MLHDSAGFPTYLVPTDELRPELRRQGDPEPADDGDPRGPRQRWTLIVGDQEIEDAVTTFPEPAEELSELTDLADVDWDAADAWYEEAEQIDVHPRDPYHRVDARKSDRRVRVRIHGEEVASTERPTVVFETSVRPRYYIPREDIRMDLLEKVDRETGCPYKGRARYLSARTPAGEAEHVAWSYPSPLPGHEKLAGLVAFHGEKDEVELTVE